MAADRIDLIDLIDLDALAQAAREGDAAWFDEHRTRLGFEVSAGNLKRLLPLIGIPTGPSRRRERATLTVQRAFGVMLEAAQGDAGVALKEVLHDHGGKDVVLAYRDSTHVHVTSAFAPRHSTRVSELWPSLSPWYTNLARNRERLAAWIGSPGSPTILSFPLVARGGQSINSATRERLLAAVLANPEDTAARLVYADWLIEQGDAQGRLIQVSEAAWALHHNDPRRRKLEREAYVLAECFGARIAGDVAQSVASYSLQRGFVDTVWMSSAGFAKHFQRLSTHHPIRTLCLRPANASALARLGATPALQLLTELALVRRWTPSSQSLVPLFQSPHFTALEALSLSHWDAGHDAFDAFATLQAPALRSLELYQVEPLDEVLAGLAANPALALETLEIKAERSFDAGLLQGPTFANLRWVEISGPMDDDAGFPGASPVG